MCAILEILPNVSIPYFHLDNVVNNNEDGYGLIIKHKDRLEIIKECPVDGTDPVDIQNLLEKHKSKLRYLHLRHKTEGDISLENCHPYNCYDADGIQIEFAHNGTMHEYRPVTEMKLNGVVTREADPRSDSKIFVDKILVPLFKAMKTPDYSEEFALNFINKMWPVSSNRGILISNKFPTLLINPQDWKTIKTTDSHGNAVEFRASNDDYFTELKRGREYDRLKAIKEAEAAAKRASSTFSATNAGASSSGWALTRLKDIDLKCNNWLGDDLPDILNDIDLHTDAGVAALGNITEPEFLDLCGTKPDVAAGLLVLVTGSFKPLYEQFLDLEARHKTASNMVASGVSKVKTLEGIISRLAKDNAELKSAA